MKANNLLALINEIVYDTVMVGFVATDPRITELKNKLYQFLKPFKPDPPLDEHHISLSYLLKDSIKEDLADVLEDAKHYNITFEALNLVLLPGVYVPFDFLTIKLKPSEGFFQLKNAVEKIATPKPMPGGFKSHLTLLRFKKGSVPNLAKEIEGKKMFEKFIITPTSVALWGTEGKIEKQVELR